MGAPSDCSCSPRATGATTECCFSVLSIFFLVFSLLVSAVVIDIRGIPVFAYVCIVRSSSLGHGGRWRSDRLLWSTAAGVVQTVRPFQFLSFRKRRDGCAG